MIKALILDLDDTIFPTKTITDEVFAGVYELMAQYRGVLSDEKMETVKGELSRTPFQEANGDGLKSELKDFMAIYNPRRKVTAKGETIKTEKIGGS